jgi:sugar lactone lactonase YvrE
VSADGTRIVVTQTGTSLDTVMMDRQGAPLGVLKPPADLIPQAHQLFVATNPATSEFWTADRFNGAVVVYAANGTYSRIFDQGAGLANWQPLGIGFDQAGNVYIADVSTDPVVIHVFGSDGKLVRNFGAGAGLNHPNGIAVDANGTVYVTDTANGRLLVFDASGAKVGTVERGDAVGNLGLPVGIGIDDHGRILVVDSSASTVQAYAPMTSGDRGPGYVNTFGQKGAGDGAFSYPNGLAIDARGRVYVADWGNDRLQVWSY